MEKAAEKTVLILGILITFCLSVFGFICSYIIFYNEDNQSRMTKSMDLSLGLCAGILVYILVLLLIGFGLRKLQKTSSNTILLFIVMVATCVVGLWWMLAADRIPTDDQAAIYGMASYFMNGDFTGLAKGGYLEMYPHQLGLVFLVELLFRFVGEYNYHALQWLNVFLVPGIIFAGSKLTKTLFKNTVVTKYYLLLMTGCLPLVFYTPWIYGELPSIFFSMLLLHFATRYMDTGSKFDGILAIVTATFAYLTRTNAIVFLIAVFLVITVKSISNRKPLKLVCGLCVLVLPILMNQAIIKSYEIRSGYELDGGMPKTLWIAMGMQEAEMGPGWFNGYATGTYGKCGYEDTLANEAAKQCIAQRTTTFREDPAYGIGFLARKLLTQWSNPSFHSLELNYTYGTGLNNYAQKIYSGEWHDTVHGVMNVYQIVIYAGSFLFLLSIAFSKSLEKRELLKLCPIVAVIGGFILSIIWEANSRYMLPYFVVLIPYSAATLTEIEGKEWSKRWSKFKIKKD